MQNRKTMQAYSQLKNSKLQATCISTHELIKAYRNLVQHQMKCCGTSLPHAAVCEVKNPPARHSPIYNFNIISTVKHRT
jgi:hypothetical protein